MESDRRCLTPRALETCRSSRRTTCAKYSARPSACRERSVRCAPSFSPHLRRAGRGRRRNDVARTRRAGRLHRAKRRREIDDDQDADRHSRADVGRSPRGGHRPVGAAQGERAQHRGRFRTAQPALLGSSADRVVRTAAGDLRDSARIGIVAISTNSSRFWRWKSSCARRCDSFRSDSACAAILPLRCCTARPSSILTSRRSASTSSPKTRSRDVHRAHQRGARNDDRPHHPRPRRSRAALPPYRSDRPRHDHLRRRRRAHQERVRHAFARSSCVSASRCEQPHLEGAELEASEGAAPLPLRPQSRARRPSRAASQRTLSRRRRQHRGARPRVDHPAHLRRRVRPREDAP